MIALIQEHQESAHAFAARVTKRVDRLLEQGTEIRRFALLVAAGCWGVPTLRARLESLRKGWALSADAEVQLHLDSDWPT